MKKYILILVILTLSAMSDESISSQIEAIKNAPPEQRVEMMNHLKLQIAQMNEAQSAQAIDKVYGKMKRQRLGNCQNQGQNGARLHNQNGNRQRNGSGNTKVGAK